MAGADERVVSFRPTAHPMWGRQWPRRAELRKSPLANSHFGAIHLRAANPPPTPIQIIAHTNTQRFGVTAISGTTRSRARGGAKRRKRRSGSITPRSALKVDRPFLVGDCRRGYHFT